jgi:hypothetical protein
MPGAPLIPGIRSRRSWDLRSSANVCGFACRSRTVLVRVGWRVRELPVSSVTMLLEKAVESYPPLIKGS